MSLITQHDADLSSVFYDTDRGFALSAIHNGVNTFPVLLEAPYYENAPGGALYIKGREIIARARRTDVDDNSVAVADTINVQVDGSAQTFDIAKIEPTGNNEYFLTLRQQ